MKPLDFIRGIVRPSLTWIGFVALTALVFLGKVDTKEYIIIVTGMLSYWFADRKKSS